MDNIKELLQNYILRSVILRTLSNKINRVYSKEIRNAKDFFEKGTTLSFANTKFEMVQVEFEKSCELLFDALQKLSVEEKQQVYNQVNRFIEENNAELEKLIERKEHKVGLLTNGKYSPLDQKNILGEISTLENKIEKVSIMISSYENIVYYLKALIEVKREKHL